jgi:hemoglobin
MKPDILTKEDIHQLVDTFYNKINNDELLSPIFNEVAGIDWAHHLPKMYQFWGTQIIGTMYYQGQPFPPHMKLNLSAHHFNRWLQLFIETVNDLFQGVNAEMALYKANNIATIFQYKLGISK